jgi:hypothetical protein
VFLIPTAGTSQRSRFTTDGAAIVAMVGSIVRDLTLELHTIQTSASPLGACRPAQKLNPDPRATVVCARPTEFEARAETRSLVTSAARCWASMRFDLLRA